MALGLNLNLNLDLDLNLDNNKKNRGVLKRLCLHNMI